MARDRCSFSSSLFMFLLLLPVRLAIPISIFRLIIGPDFFCCCFIGLRLPHCRFLFATAHLSTPSSRNKSQYAPTDRPISRPTSKTPNRSVIPASTLARSSFSRRAGLTRDRRPSARRRGRPRCRLPGSPSPVAPSPRPRRPCPPRGARPAPPADKPLSRSPGRAGRSAPSCHRAGPARPAVEMRRPGTGLRGGRWWGQPERRQSLKVSTPAGRHPHAAAELLDNAGAGRVVRVRNVERPESRKRRVGEGDALQAHAAEARQGQDRRERTSAKGLLSSRRSNIPAARPTIPPRAIAVPPAPGPVRGAARSSSSASVFPGEGAKSSVREVQRGEGSM